MGCFRPPGRSSHVAVPVARVGGGSFGWSVFAGMGCDVATNARPAGGPPGRLGQLRVAVVFPPKRDIRGFTPGRRHERGRDGRDSAFRRLGSFGVPSAAGAKRVAWVMLLLPSHTPFWFSLLIWGVVGRQPGAGVGGLRAPSSEDPTVGVCFDADRLDLGRVDVEPDPELMSTDAGRRRAVTHYRSANQRASESGQ